MGKTRTFRVINNRLQFRCPGCGTKKNITVPPSLRRRNIRCHRCGEVTRCVFNRRALLRELQTGKAVLITNTGRELDINLYDISPRGIGFEMAIGAARTRAVSVGDQIRLRCSWNQRLLGGGRFVVQNIRGQRVGVRKMVVNVI